MSIIILQTMLLLSSLLLANSQRIEVGPSQGLNNCPMTSIRTIIRTTADSIPDNNGERQIPMITVAVQNEYSGKWGVVIVQNVSLISKIVHWAIPDIKDSNGIPLYCNYVYRGSQYSVFKIDGDEANGRATVADEPRVVVPGRLRKGSSRLNGFGTALIIIIAIASKLHIFYYN